MPKPSQVLCLLLLTTVAAAPAVADERAAARRFSQARDDEPSLIAFLKAMPKGGDLHYHFGAGIFAEDALRNAVKQNLHYDPATRTFSPTAGPGTVPAARVERDTTLRYEFLNWASLRGLAEGSGPAVGHDHFFRTFRIFGSATEGRSNAEYLVDTVQRARLQNMQYLELMATPAGEALFPVQEAARPGESPEQAVVRLKPLIDAYVKAARAEMDERGREAAKVLGFDPQSAAPDVPVRVRYLVTAYRNGPPERILATWAAGFALMKADPRVVGVNFAAPEDDPVARRDFSQHMEILGKLWQLSSQPNISLHAGELNLWISPVEEMTYHIRRSIEVGRARRIGHGISVAWEDNLPGLLAKMRKEGIAVEICPSSNDRILGAAKDQHPFRLYRRAGVPLTLNTDDEGVNRSNLTLEFVKAVRSWNLSYAEVKELARNSLEYSFLSGESLYEERDYKRLRPQFRALRKRGWVVSAADEALLRASEKAAAQVRLERALREFEDHPPDVEAP